MPLKALLRVHAILAITALVSIPAACVFATSEQRMTGLAIAFGLSAVAFAFNGYLGVSRGKMHMQIGTVISQQSRGTKMFKMDVAIQFAGAALSLCVACWLLVKAFG